MNLRKLIKSAKADQESDEVMAFLEPSPLGEASENGTSPQMMILNGAVKPGPVVEPAAKAAPEAAPPAVQAPGLRDRVVDRLLQKGIVTLEQVQEVQKQWRQEGEQNTLWRVLTQHPRANRDGIFGEAARIYAFRQEEVNQHRPDSAFVQRMLDSFSKEHREQLIELRLLPLEYEIDPRRGVLRLLFATHDPSRPETLRFVHDLKLEHFELC